MGKTCNFKTSEASTKSLFRTRNLIDGFLNIPPGQYNKFIKANREYSEYINNTHGILGMLFSTSDDGNKAIPNKEMFYRVDAANGIIYEKNSHYRKNYNKDITLTPEDMVAKYVVSNADGTNVTLNTSKTFNLEEITKLTIGITRLYPGLIVKPELVGVFDKQKKYRLFTKARPIDTITVTATDTPSFDEMYDSKEKLIIEEVMAPLLKKFKGVKVNWVTQEEMNELAKGTGKTLISKGDMPTGLALRNKIYLVEGAVTASTALEELLHTFVDTLAVERQALYMGLKAKAKELYPVLVAQLERQYPNEQGFTQEDRDVELVTRVLRDAYIQERKDRPQGIEVKDFMKLVREFFKWVVNKLKDLYDIVFDEPRADLSNLPLNLTIGELAAYLNVNDVMFTGLETTGPRFNKAMPSEDFDPETKYDAEAPEDPVEKAEYIKNKKIRKINDQINRLTEMVNRLKDKRTRKKTKEFDAMINTMDTLIKNSNDYLDVLTKEEETVSTTKFIGSAKFDEALQEKFLPYQQFGTGLHAFMEEIQIDAIENNNTPSGIFFYNPEYVKSLYEKLRDKGYFNLKSIDDDGNVTDVIPLEKLLPTLANLVGIINEPFLSGELVLPEITIMGKDSMNRNIVGRVDYAVLKTDGSVSNYDFKTTKAKTEMYVYNDKDLRREYYTKELEEGVHPAFQRFIGRSKIMSWLGQVGVYSRIFGQMGIETKGDTIINITYSPNREMLDEDEEWVLENMFVAKLPIAGEYGLGMDTDEDGRPIPQMTPLYKQITRALRQSMPVPGEIDSEDSQQKITRDREYISTIPIDKMKLIIKSLESRINAQLEEVNAEIKRLYRSNADESVIKQAENRQSLLREAKSWFERTMLVEGESKPLPEEFVLKGLLDKTNELISEYLSSMQALENETDVNKVISELGERNKQMSNLKDFLEVFRSALLNDKRITEDNPVVATINNAINKAIIGQGIYISAAGKQFIKAILSMPKKNVQEMMRQMELYYEIEIPRLEKIIAGDTSIFDKGSFWLGSAVRKVFGRSTPNKTITQEMKDAAKKKLDRIKYFLSKKEFNEEFVKEYVENTFQNPESGFYIGSTIQTGFGMLTGDDFRSSYGNSELAITAMANYAISMTQGATTRFFDRMESIKVGKMLENFASKFGGYTAANSAISKMIELEDFATGEKVKYMSFRGPISQEYKDIIDRHAFEKQQLNEQISAIAASDLPEDEKKAKIKEISKVKDQKRKEYAKWLVENAQTKLVPELYALEASLPDEIKAKIDEKNKLIANLKTDAHDMDWMLTDSQLLEIKRLEFEIATLRKEATMTDASLIDIFETMDKYYEWVPNERKYDYARLQVIKQYGEDSEEYRRWRELNSDHVADPKWVEELIELKNQKSALYDDNPELDELNRQRNELISKYKYRSRFSSRLVFNPLYMTDEDYMALTIIEEQIDDFYNSRSEGGFEGLSKDEIDKIKARSKEAKLIQKKIDALRMTRNKPEYTREFTERVNEINNLIELKLNETDPGKKASLESQILTKDLEFKKWYDRNNIGNYKLGTIEKKGKVDASPTRFNVMEVPTDPARMTWVPNSNYRTRTYKEEAYNPDYNHTLEKQRYSYDYYPSPKGINYNKDTGRFEVDKTSKWVDKDYLEMIRDPEVEAFFNSYVMDEYYNKQANLSAHKLGFIYPGDTQSAVDTLAVDGLNGAKREAMEWVNRNILLGASDIEKSENTYGIAGQMRIRFSHNYKLPATIGTKDGINAIMKWGLQYEIYNAMEQANLVISPSIEYLKYYVRPLIATDNDVARQQVDKVIDILEFERNKFIYGQQFITPQDAESSWSTQKLLRQFMTAVSWGRLAFDPAMQVGNLISGNVQMFLSMQMKEGGNGTWKDWTFAKSQMYARDGFMYSVISDWGKVDDVSLATKILRYFNPSMRSFEDVVDLANRNKMRRLLNRAFNIGDIAYIIQDKGEMEIAMSTLLKNLSAHKYFVYEMNPDNTRKVDDKGEYVFVKDASGANVTVSAYEALVDTGKATPGIRPDVAMTDEELDGIRARTHQEYIQMQGNYAAWTQPKVASSMWGTLLLYYRKYLEPFIENRFKGLGGVGDPKNWAAGQAQIGWWTAFFKMIRTIGLPKALYALLPGMVTEKFSIQDVNPYYKAKAGQLRRELLFATIAMFAYTTLRSLRYGDDDEKKELSWGQMQAMRVMAKVANESRSMVYVPYIGRGDDFVQNFATFTTAFNEGKTLFRMVENLGYYSAYELFDSETAFDNGYYQRRSYRYEAGTPKVTANFYALSGIENVLDIINPEYSVSKLYLKKG